MASKTTKKGSKTSKKSNTKQKNIKTASNSTSKKPNNINFKDENRSKLKKEISAIMVMAIGVFVMASLNWNLTGEFGKNISAVLKGLFGLCAYVMPALLIVYGIMIFTKYTKPVSIATIIFLSIIFTSINLINAGQFLDYGAVRETFSQIYSNSQRLDSGGVLGIYLGSFIIGFIGKVGLYLFSLVSLFASIMLILNKPFSNAYKDAVNKKNEISSKRRAKRESVSQGKEDDRNFDFIDESEKTNRSYKDEIESKRKKKSIINLMKNDENYGVQGEVDENKGNKVDKNKISSTHEFISFGYNPYDSVKKDSLVPANNIDNNIDKKNNIKADNKNIDFLNDNFMDSAYLDRKDRYVGFDDFNSEDVISVSEVDVTQSNNQDLLKRSAKKENIDSRAHQNDNNRADNISRDLNIDNHQKESVDSNYTLPPLSLLNTPPRVDKISNTGVNLRSNAILLEDTLKSFNVDAKVINVTKGSSVTRYEIQPAIGVKVASIVRLADDVALNLRARSIRIEAPIPGKAAVGIEVENEKREMVTVREIISSKEFEKHQSNLAFAVGKDIAGIPVVADLAKMPHMLIAGATGAGKSVCINTIIASILYRSTPDEVKLILIDPKMVELGNYNGIPHLLIPVVTDSNKAAAALNWAVSEMTQRYKKFASKNVKDLKSYNQLMIKNGDGDQAMAKIVIVIDELADLMMVASSQVEDAIARLAQLARAAGMHLIVATQRPSVDVVTGIIKANIPSRIAFMVSSQIDSRTILDMAGAEKLVGNGDMLYKPQDADKPIRVQGPYISDEEVHKIIEFVKNQGIDQNYDNEIISQVDKGNLLKGDDRGDELLDDAIRMVLQAEQASASMLQRRFRIGYNRAARMIDTMEALGIIGGQEGSKPRSVKMTLEEYENSILKDDESEKI